MSLDQFKKKYLEEASELIVGLEEALLVLEHNTSDTESISSVFRIMHTLKGNSAMFGYNIITDFTHHLENIYDLVRQGKIELNNEIFNVTLASVDHLRNLMDDMELTNSINKVTHNQLQSAILKIVNQIQSGKEHTESSVIKNDNPDTLQSDNNFKTFHLSFIPSETIFKNGTNPLYLIDDLYNLGSCLAYPVLNLPELNELQPELCYTSWNVLIATDKSVNDIRDVFIFVEDDCEIKINELAIGNLLTDIEFINTLEQNPDKSIHTIEEIARKYQESKANQGYSTKQPDTLKNPSSLKVKESFASIRVSSEKIDEMMNLVSELVTVQARLSLYAENHPTAELVNIAENVQKLSRQLRDNAFSISLVPVQSVITKFQRLVRDLSNELKKEVDFVTEGTETELDKNIIESLSDPIMHILRNSMDHGIEDKKIRKKKGKQEKATIKLKAFYSGVNVFIEISDDGAGINKDSVLSKAKEKGLIPDDEHLTDKQIYDLIFLPGFSTASKVTGVSGRGVGMDVVKRKIGEIRGEVFIDSIQDKGTTITIKLPLTLSIIDGLLVKVDQNYFVIPLSGIDKCYPMSKKELDGLFNNTAILDGIQVPCLNLRNEFELYENYPEILQIIVVNFNASRVGIAVDKVVGEYQAVLKPLGKIYKDQDNISGATILGDGTIALVIDPFKVISEFDKKAKELSKVN